MSLILKFLPGMMDLSFLSGTGFSSANSKGVYEIPFLDRMGIVFQFCCIGMWIISTIENKRGVKTNGLEVDKSMFKVHPVFAVGSLIILGIIAAL